MYTSFFGLNEKPFSITPDPRYLFMSERHGEALAHLVYGVTESGGFIQLTGEVGTGKTTLVRTLLLNRMPENADVAVVLNPQLSAHEFLATICEELEIKVPKNSDSSKALTDALNRHLLKAHAESRRTILVVDEAQNLAPAVLEQVRLLTNLETAKQKLLQIILIGQPELRDLLARNDLRQLAQRITGRYHLKPLSRDETALYVEHRLRVAGALGEVFDNGAKREIYRLSQGVPRLINVICDRALLGAYSQESRRVNRRLVKRAAAEVAGEIGWTPLMRRMAIAAGIFGAGLMIAGIWSLAQQQQQQQTIAETQLTTPAVVSEPTLLPVPVQTVITLLEQLELAAELTGIDSALSALFDLWNYEYESGTRDVCTQAAAAGLACLYQRGSWSGLRQLDRPAILSLVDSGGNTHEIVLTAIHGDNAELSIGGIKVTHPIVEVSSVWFGHYMLLWRPANGLVVSLAPGSTSRQVLWLRESLAAIDERYRSNNMASDLYDNDIKQIVSTFQRDHRLDIDGLAGKQTQIIINSLLAIDGTPRLTTTRLAQDP
jgi:general secretion pathway protein A